MDGNFTKYSSHYKLKRKFFLAFYNRGGELKVCVWFFFSYIFMISVRFFAITLFSFHLNDLCRVRWDFHHPQCRSGLIISDERSVFLWSRQDDFQYYAHYCWHELKGTRCSVWHFSFRPSLMSMSRTFITLTNIQVKNVKYTKRISFLLSRICLVRAI